MTVVILSSIVGNAKWPSLDADIMDHKPLCIYFGVFSEGGRVLILFSLWINLM